MAVYDYDAAGNYILTEPYARNIRDKIGDTFKAIPITISENTQATFDTNKAAFEAQILADLEPTAVAAEVIAARDAFVNLDTRLDDMTSKTTTADTKANNIKTDLLPAKNAGGVFLPVGISTFTANGNITLTTTYPQIIPLTKLAGDLNLASNIITLPKGFLYRMDLAFMGTGAGYSYLRILDPLNSSLGGTCTVAGSTDTSGRSATSLFMTYDLTSAESDLQIRVANILLGGAVQLQGGYGNLMITKYLKIPFANL